MPRRLVKLFILMLLLAAPALRAQSGAPGGATKSSPDGKSSIPDLSGFWGPGYRGTLTWDPDDPGGRKPELAPMTPWAMARFKEAHPPFGIGETFEAINDPVQRYCDPTGVSRIYFYPWQFMFMQTPDTIYMLYEFGRFWRSIAMNRDHPKDPDSTWLGDSIGKYEGDTLVIDTVGFNDKTWLDHVGHPHSDSLHLIERFRRVNHDTLELTVTVDDPKAYTKTFTASKLFKFSTSPMGETLCSMSEMESFQKKVIEPSLQAPPK